MKKILTIALSIVITLTTIFLPNNYEVSALNILSGAKGSDYTKNAALANKLDQIFAGNANVYASSYGGLANPVNVKLGSYSVPNNGVPMFVGPRGGGALTSGTSCYIYANGVYYTLFNEVVSSPTPMKNSEALTIGADHTMTYENFVKWGVRNAPGAYFRLPYHSFVVLKYDKNNLTVLEGNADGYQRGLVKITSIRWDQVYTFFWTTQVNYIVQPKEAYFRSLYGSGSSTTTNPVTKYSIVFDANGGSGAPSKQTKTKDVTLKLSTDIPTRKGYSFLGWSTSSSATKAEYKAGANYTKNANATLYAIWEKSKVAVSSVALNKTSLTMKNGETATLTATVKPNNASNKSITWSSSDTKVATVDANGKVSAKGKGSATITATTNDGKKKATCKVTVTQPVTGVSLNKTSASLNIGATLALSATVKPTNANNKNVTWASSNTKVATVDANGKVSAKAKGSATITVTTKDGSKKATCKITVKQPVTSVTLNKTSETVNKGKTVTLTATVKPDNADNKAVTWASSNTSVATVDASGKVTAKANGTAKITVTTKDGKKTATYTITVISQEKVTFNTTSATLGVKKAGKYQNTIQIKATVEPNAKLTWSSSDPKIAKVDQNGLVTAVSDSGVGVSSVTITAKTANGGKATAKIIVEDPINAFVRRLYSYCLNRTADANGFAYWTKMLRNKEITASKAVQGFFESNEMVKLKLSDREFLKRCYLVMMGRNAASSELDYWQNEIKRRKMYRRGVIEQFILSNEFTKICKDYNLQRGYIDYSIPLIY
ncbi:MAG: Ig-like domain-containing protein [Solobacterium sp.]|nr:Ig-like domain-containing protein [Solobacterium sp.]